MKLKSAASPFAAFALCAGIVYACGFDTTMRAYLSRSFWLGFGKSSSDFLDPSVARADVPFAGMRPLGDAAGESTPLDRLRAAYREIALPMPAGFDAVRQLAALEEAYADGSLTRLELEEVELIDAKIDMRLGGPDDTEPLLRARQKLEDFLSRRSDPAFLSEARGWLARVHYLLGDGIEAGKIYLDELNREGSNVSAEAVLSSLRTVFGRGRVLEDHLEEFFDTPEHAVYAVTILTNPTSGIDQISPGSFSEFHQRVMTLVRENEALFTNGPDSRDFVLLLMRTALRMGDPGAAVEVARAVPVDAAVTADPDFLWMYASGLFVTGDYAAAEAPLLAIAGSADATDEHRAAALYGLVGVYQKTENVIEQIRYGLRVDGNNSVDPPYEASVYWALSDFDLLLLLDYQASIEELEEYIRRYPDDPQIRTVRYSLAVRLTREDRYAEAAEIYEEIQAVRRAPRMRALADLYQRTLRSDLSREARLQAQYDFAERLSQHPDGIYFNDLVWMKRQRFALRADEDFRLTDEQRATLAAGERKLRDDQEERWRAYQILQGVVDEAGRTPLGRQAAELAIECLRRIRVDRFGRAEEIHDADLALSLWLVGED